MLKFHQTGANHRAYLSMNQADGRFYSVSWNRAIHQWTAHRNHRTHYSDFGCFDTKEAAMKACEDDNALQTQPQEAR